VVPGTIDLAELVNNETHDVSVVFRTGIPLWIVTQPIKESSVRERFHTVRKELDSWGKALVREVINWRNIRDDETR
jgi:hypothetical protein